MMFEKNKHQRSRFKTSASKSAANHEAQAGEARSGVQVCGLGTDESFGQDPGFQVSEDKRCINRK